MKDVTGSLSGAEGAVEIEKNSSKTSGSTHCLNCGTPLNGLYCYHCGQRDLPRRQALGDLMINFISSFWSFESKFFKTFGTLLFRPGVIIKDYNQGKRDTYYHPARMYVFLSFIFFLIFSYTFSTDEIRVDENGDINSSASQPDSTKSKPKVTSVPYVHADTLEINTVEEYDSLQAALPEKDRANFLERFFTRKGIEVGKKAEADGTGVLVSFLNIFFTNLPRMIFILLPVFALLLKLLYVRRDFYYSEHLVFAVFFYDFLYLLGSIGLLLSAVDWLVWGNFVLGVWVFIYLYKSMRKVYQQRRGKTIFKFLLLNGAFVFILLFALLGVVVYSFAQM